MGTFDEDRRPEANPASSDSEPPFQALFPNLDRLSRSSFRRGTVSRRRINRSLGGFGAVVVVAAGIIVAVIVL